ncbi:MAG: hypothetical protein HPY44_20670 [Armatimonadetes bacterium]|nr:hypothetical protein [Armatimonadota bacterium]
MNPAASNWVLAIVAVVALGLLWQQVFAMTGVLWWDAPSDVQKVPRPAPPVIQPPDTDWVDLKAYLGTHPVWRP